MGTVHDSSSDNSSSNSNSSTEIMRLDNSIYTTLLVGKKVNTSAVLLPGLDCLRHEDRDDGQQNEDTTKSFLQTHKRGRRVTAKEEQERVGAGRDYINRSHVHTWVGGMAVR